MLWKASCCIVNVKPAFMLFLILCASKFSISGYHYRQMQSPLRCDFTVWPPRHSVPHLVAFPPTTWPSDLLIQGEEGKEHNPVKLTRLQRTGAWIAYQLTSLKIAGECQEHNCVTGRNLRKSDCLGAPSWEMRFRLSPSSYHFFCKWWNLAHPAPPPQRQNYPYYLLSLFLWFQNKQTLTKTSSFGFTRALSR